MVNVGLVVIGNSWFQNIINGYVKVIPQQHTYESVFNDEVFKREFAVIPPHNIDD